MRDNIKKLANYYDERNTSLSDYSIMMKNLPMTKGIQQKITRFFKESF